MSYPYFRMYPGDYRRDTSHLTLAEHGAYALLLCQYYATGKPLPADQQSLCRICSAQTPEEIAAVRTVADAFFAPNGDGLRHNKRADRELSDLAELSATNVERARKAAVRSWEVRRGSSQAYAPSNAPSSATSIRQAMLEQCQPEPEPEPAPESEPAPPQAASQPPAPDDGKPSRKRAAPPEPDDAWIASMRTKYAAIGVDVDAELVRMDGWLQTPKGARRKRTRAFIVGWLNRADRACEGGKTPAPSKYRSNLINIWHNPNPDQEARSAF